MAGYDVYFHYDNLDHSNFEYRNPNCPNGNSLFGDSGDSYGPSCTKENQKNLYDPNSFNRTLHSSQLLQKLNYQRISGQFCDVDIDIDGTIYKAHRAILSATSPYFQAMFSVGLKEQEEAKIQLHLIHVEIFDIILEYIYTGVINVDECNVQELMKTADMFQMNNVVSLCSQFLRQTLNSSNAVGIYRFSETHNFRELESTVVNFIESNFPKMSEEEEFLDMPKECLIKFLCSEHLRVDSEVQVFHAALTWIMHDLEERRCYVFEILQHVRIPLLPLRLLTATIDECSDSSVQVALKSIKNDLVSRKGSLVSLFACPRLCAKKDIFVVGGSKRELVTTWTRSPGAFTYSSVMKFDTFKREWNKVASMKSGRVLPGVAALDGKVYVLGGEEESEILSSGECYVPEKNIWCKIASMVVPRCEFGLCTVNNSLYALGGWVGEDIGSSVERYYPKLDKWRIEGSLPEPLFSMGVASYDGLIYVVGGCTHSRRHLQDARSFNPVTGEWCKLPPMLVPRSQMGVAVFERHLYVIGGCNKHNEVLQSVERYSFDSKKWTKVSQMKVGRTCPAVSPADGRLYVIGGMRTKEVNFWRAQVSISSVECYDPKFDEWSDCPPLPDSRGEAGAALL